VSYVEGLVSVIGHADRMAADVFDAELFKRCQDLLLVRDLADVTGTAANLADQVWSSRPFRGSGSPGVPMPHMLPVRPKSSETRAVMLLISRD
jgi:hypothetical protein